MSGIRTCDELVDQSTQDRFSDKVNVRRYERLYPSGRTMIQNWFLRAWERIDCNPSESFEPFIYTWFAFNAWASCVTGFERDWKWKVALSINPRLIGAFEKLIEDGSSVLFSSVINFYSLWPIFKSSEIREKEAFYAIEADRIEVVHHYFKMGITDFQPGCWRKHFEHGEIVPVDWSHTLAVLYRVRCNLFHGEKGIESMMDQEIVHAAFLTLSHFIHATNLLGIDDFYTPRILIE